MRFLTCGLSGVVLAPIVGALALLGAGVVSADALADEVLADPAAMLTTAERVDFVGANRFVVVRCPYGRCLRSRPRLSASGLYQPVSLTATALFNVQWSWRVDKIHKRADISKRGLENFGAMVAFIFGTPSLLNRDVPTVAYVWTSSPVAIGSVVLSERFAHARFIQLHGPGDRGSWQLETRNVIEDFKAVFGYRPGRLRYIAIFNDNDQTGETTSATFAPIYSRQPR